MGGAARNAAESSGICRAGGIAIEKSPGSLVTARTFLLLCKTTKIFALQSKQQYDPGQHYFCEETRKEEDGLENKVNDMFFHAFLPPRIISVQRLCPRWLPDAPFL